MHDILLLTMGAVGAWLGTRWLAAHPPRVELIAWSIALLLTGALPVIFVAPQLQVASIQLELVGLLLLSAFVSDRGEKYLRCFPSVGMFTPFGSPGIYF